MERNTHQKQSILHALETLRGQHPTAEMVYERVVQSIPMISRATVYRVLNQFAEQGSILQLHFPASGDRYDDVVSPHHHMVCNECKNVVDLTGPQFTEIPLPQRDASGCQITDIDIIFRGRCPVCAAIPT